MENQYVFQVNLAGMLELLSENIYSNPGVFYRELLQNGVDAITARKKAAPDFDQGCISISISQDPTGMQELRITDNGIGLTEEEAHTFLAVIGNSSKREGGLEQDDFIGRFGIGLLSCLVVSEEICVISRSVHSPSAIQWVGKADGTYQVSRLDEEVAIGTSIVLKPRKSWKHYFKAKSIAEGCLHYGDALPYPIYLSDTDGEKKLLNELSPVWLNDNPGREELLRYGEQQFNTLFLDAFPIKTSSGLVEGAAFILPQKAQLSAKKTQKVYLKRMLVSESVENLLPDWAFFLKCVVNSQKLKPTASREALVEDGLTQLARQELGDEIKKYLYRLAREDVKRLVQLLKIHYTPLKAIAAEDHELLELIIDYIPFETSRGSLTFKEIVQVDKHIYYTPSLDDFRQIKRIAGSKGILVINAAYSYDEDLIRQIGSRNPSIRIEQISPANILEGLSRLHAFEEDHYAGLQKITDSILQAHCCRVEIRKFSPADTPVLYISDEEAQVKKRLFDMGKKANNPFTKVLHQVGNPDAEARKDWPVLCLNAENKLIQKLCTYTDTEIIRPIVLILYLQALQLGQYPIQAQEMKLLNDSLCKVLSYGLSEFGNISGNPHLN